ncbi:MAG: nucleotidyltransferase family protein [Clostridiales bacterium]|nr:nucleotidyltransferase family protein [Clostridiales bacterium]
MDGFNIDLQSQLSMLTKIVMENCPIRYIIEKAAGMELNNYYVGAGCIAQTVWNHQMGLELTNGISDIDFVYFDKSDLSVEAENAVIEMLIDAMEPCPIKLDIKNQARVHLWYKDHFGYDIEPYKTVEEAINTWPTTATSIGMRLENDVMKVYAPVGLNDLFGMIIRPNKVQITEEIYIQKVKKWIAKWPELTIVPW